jgi:hypothetical protein
MKVLKIFALLAICLAGFVYGVYSQPCAGFSVKVFVRDQAFKIVPGAQVEAVRLPENGKREIYTKSSKINENAYELMFSLPKLGEYFKEDFLLRASAKNLKTGELKVNFPDCKTRSFEFILKPQNAEAVELEYLVGKIKDKKGRAVVGAKITATGENGRIYEALTDDNGDFDMDLPLGVYKIQIEYKNQKYSRGTTKITSEFGTNFLELVL